MAPRLRNLKIPDAWSYRPSNMDGHGKEWAKITKSQNFISLFVDITNGESSKMIWVSANLSNVLLNL